MSELFCLSWNSSSAVRTELWLLHLEIIHFCKARKKEGEERKSWNVCVAEAESESNLILGANKIRGSEDREVLQDL